MSDSYDLIVIGAGPGGYVAAIRAAQLGLKTACIDKRKSLGGTCLNIGCIPSKALLESSHHFVEARGGLAKHGVKTGKVELDLAAMMARKTKIVEQLTQGIAFLFKKNKIDAIEGTARITGPGEITLDGKRKLNAKNILIATGSDVTPLPGVGIDEKRIVSSTGALELGQVPKTMVVIGAGVIGLEMGSVWARLGTQVTVVEFLGRILPEMDGELARMTQRVLTKQGLKFRLGSKVTAAKAGKSGVVVSVEAVDDSAKVEEIPADIVLLAIGRRPFTEGLGLEEIGVKRDDRGFIEVDAKFQTNVPGVYAIGDVIPGPMLAHKAEEEGVAMVEILAGQAGHVNYETVPGVVYTWPEIASVGKTEEQLKEAGTSYNVGKFPFTANSRARAADDSDGFVKILADARSDRVLGVHIIGPDAGTLIHEAVMAMEFGGSAEDMARAFHAHPTLNEAVKEAALAVAGRAIHM
ncbi:MAG: dihydrolipoyl dehydrogenase [Alphaproteobacteria bacterium]